MFSASGVRPSLARSGLAWCSAAAFVLGGTACGAETGHPATESHPHAHAATTAPPTARLARSGLPAQPIALRDQNGRLVRTADLHGRPVLVAFLYTSCRDVCPLIAAQLNAAVATLGEQADRVRILAVSVDPDGDTPVTTRRYVRTHHLGPQFHWLVGTRKQLAPVWQGYNILVESRSIEEVAHSAPVLLLDGRWRTRASYSFPPNDASQVARDLRTLLAERSS